MLRLYKRIGIIAIAVLLPILAGAQAFSKVNLPTEMCGGDTLTFTFGYNPHFDVVISNRQSSLSCPGKVFLPDGEPCGDYGCSYRSSVTFTDFAQDAAITSVQDLKYVRLNIEHSYIGDLYINITCPSGQKADLMRFGGVNDSGCQDAIPSTSASWLGGSNMATGTYFGVPFDQENSNMLCDSSAFGNEAGVGWNYCWSDNTSSGYVYASGDGIIYRAGHSDGVRVDSSDAAAGINFYHPDQSFSQLIGCPLNGPWYIEVVDGYSQDNGYIFDWEMALDEALLPPSCQIVERYVTSPYVHGINDSTYHISMPLPDADTVVDVVLSILTSCGDTIDSIVPIIVHRVDATYESDTVCGVYTWAGVSYYSDTTVIKHFSTESGCDSLVLVNLTVFPTNYREVFDTVVENELPISFENVTFESGTDTVFSYTNYWGCDSLIRYQLKVWNNVFIDFDTMVCSDKIPAYWRGVVFRAEGSTTFNLTTSHGADSIVTLTLNVLPTYDTTFADAVCSNMQYYIGNYLCDSAGHYDMMLRTVMGCDSMVHVDLTVIPVYEEVFFDTACASMGLEFDGVTYYEAGVYENSYTTSSGCDSTRILNLTIKESNPRAKADIVPRIVSIQNLTVSLRDISEGAVSRVWNVGGLTSSMADLLIEYPIEHDSLEVTLTVMSREGCYDTLREMIFLDRATMFIPNIFTPEKETNNRWQPGMYDIEQLEVFIYDRDGRLVYSYEGVDGSWDGTCGGVPCPQGAYVFLAKYRSRCFPGWAQTVKGTITLLR